MQNVPHIPSFGNLAHNAGNQDASWLDELLRGTGILIVLFNMIVAWSLISIGPVGVAAGACVALSSLLLFRQLWHRQRWAWLGSIIVVWCVTVLSVCFTLALIQSYPVTQPHAWSEAGAIPFLLLMDLLLVVFALSITALGILGRKRLRKP